MGVSLQVYGSRIGTFLTKGFKQPKTRSKNSKTSKSNLCKTLAFLLLISAFATFIHVHIQVNRGPPHVPLQGRHGGAAHLATETNSNFLDRQYWLTSKDRNFEAKIVNGNRGARGLVSSLLTGIKAQLFFTISIMRLKL